MGTYTTAQHLELFGGLPAPGEAVVDPRELADRARDEADEHGHGPVVCEGCGWHQSRGHDDCERCGESPASIAETAADHEATQRADRWL